ncbi:hypothetical protein VCHENC02_4438 [Vibrio harveyi]|uniref:Uncharacterized protein n=1 Tax=Vibrio harveyi TaxID=669 RepID=A0A454CTN4_VIBHA|nr:hypothetical protein VCHENC02_4438 [Vibrio harveyi]
MSLTLQSRQSSLGEGLRMISSFILKFSITLLANQATT